MPQVVDEGHGATLTLGTSTWDSTAKIISITPGTVARESIETTDLTTTVAKTFIPAELRDNGEFTVEFYHNDSIAPPMIDVVGPPAVSGNETITITYPKGPGQATTAPAISFSGHCTSYTDGNAATGEVRKGSATFKIAGAITYTAAAA